MLFCVDSRVEGGGRGLWGSDEWESSLKMESESRIEECGHDKAVD